jgi:hypothetical protein
LASFVTVAPGASVPSGWKVPIAYWLSSTFLVKMVALSFILRDQSGDEEVLRDGDPAVIGLGRVILHQWFASLGGFRVFFFQRFELQLLYFSAAVYRVGPV